MSDYNNLRKVFEKLNDLAEKNNIDPYDLFLEFSAFLDENIDEFKKNQKSEGDNNE